MGKLRFPSITYRNNITSETEDMIDGKDNLRILAGGTAGKERDYIHLIDDRTDKDLVILNMYPDERFKDRKPNYVIYDGEEKEKNKVAEYQQINHARNKWFELVRNHSPNRDSGENKELNDF